MTQNLVLISHHLCPYVQRAVIALSEKNITFDRVYVDLANKPDWFRALSPLGKTPVLAVDDRPIFESAVILEYLEDTQSPPLHPVDPMMRANHRGWMEFGSSILNDIAGFYVVKDAASFALKAQALTDKFVRLEARLLGDGPYFDGSAFSLVDAVFGPVFRYFDVFDEIADFGILPRNTALDRWRQALAKRKSIREAVTGDYNERLYVFLRGRNSHLSSMML